jgi:hypothetical protein
MSLVLEFTVKLGNTTEYDYGNYGSGRGGFLA